jgi:altronate dehydratase
MTISSSPSTETYVGASPNVSDRIIQLHPADPIAIAVQDITAGTALRAPGGGCLVAVDDVPAGHKIALRDLTPGETILRYGCRIGQASQPILAGSWVHTHNLEVGPISRGYTYRVVPTFVPTPSGRTFRGYLRPDGRVGTRNYLAVISSVHCVGHAASRIARHFTPERLAGFANVDGIIPIIHHSGCSLPPHGPAQRYLKRALANLAANPNIGGALFVGLGCETTPADMCAALVSEIPLAASVPWLTVQGEGGFRKAVEAGIAAVERLLPRVNACRRSQQPLAGLTLALECGGSDGWSGVTANPLVGRVADAVVREGGTAVLSETPEIFGAEALLLERVASPAVGDALIARFNWWLDHAARMGFSLDNNPTPGNKQGGLTTIFEKSLGAAAKGGSTPLNAVYEYAERIDRRGFVFMDTPGSDPPSVTGMLAGGCNLILFTTGRGTTYGSNVAPCIKIASSSRLYRQMGNDMDCNAGRITEGESWGRAIKELLELVIAVASGQKTCNELNGLAENEFVPWLPDAVL